MDDMNLLSGDFLTDSVIPKDKDYLKKYFKNGIQRAFLRYFCVEGKKSEFTNHTGFACSSSTFDKMHNKIKTLIETHDKAKKNFEFELLFKIENGKFYEKT